jgi:hypothetical protein
LGLCANLGAGPGYRFAHPGYGLRRAVSENRCSRPCDIIALFLVARRDACG